jgi:hypothetical protein
MFSINAASGVSLTVCAASYDEAAEIFVVWHLEKHGEVPGEFEVLKRNRRWPGQNRKHLEEALGAGIPGVATYDLAHGWTISPPVSSED